jgi:hypothetical protein
MAAQIPIQGGIMSFTQAILIWPERPALSFLVLFVIAVPFLYVARDPVHALIGKLVRTVTNPLRLIARWLSGCALRMRERNREVLFSLGSNEMRLSIEREFERVTTLVQRDLEGYPALQRKLMDEIAVIEEDYRKSGEVPPPPPEWVKAVEGFAKIKNNGDGVVERILADIRDSIEDIYKKIVAEYRGAYQERHHILKRSLPFWRTANQTLLRVERNITGLHDSAAKIDANVIKLQGIFGKSNKTENVLTSSASTQFFISALVMLIAAGGAYVNYKLISLPMSAMVGGGDYITANLRAAEVAALVIILFEALMGLFLMETLRFTSLFPLGNITEKMRGYLMWASLIILVVLAGVEVALAVMRDAIVAADVALKQSLGGGEAAVAAEAGWVTRIPTFGQMILGFTLPFALAFVAIPLEYLINSGRVVLGVLLVQLLRGAAFVTRLFANLVREAGKLATGFYDILIFVPLAIERWVKRSREQNPGAGKVRPVPTFEKQAAGR